MNLCRTCLKTPADKDMSHLEMDINEDNNNYFHIMMFCLHISVTQDSKITTKLCNNCFRKIISFYKFKALSLKNDLYLKSLDPAVSVSKQNLSVYVDVNGIKHENFLDTNEYGPILVEDSKSEFKIEIDLKNGGTLGDRESESEFKIEKALNSEGMLGDRDSDPELPSEKQKPSENTPNVTEEKAAYVKKRQCTLKNKNTPKKTCENVRKKTSKTNKKRGCAKKVKQPNKQSKNDYEMCEECGKSYRNLKEHIIRHQPKDQRQMLKCKVCPKLFYTKRGQNYHYKTAHLGIKSICDICNKDVVSLSVHKLLVHNPDALPFGCVSCTRRFVSQSALDMHMTSHTKVFAYECDTCHKKFQHKQSVTKHILQVHTKKIKFRCQFCSKGFLMKSRLQDHLRSHTKERPYECEECGKSFSLSHTLKSHRLIHGNVKSFRCELCNMSFVKAGYLNAHMISHTKEKRHACQYCGVRFGRSDHRRRHEFTAHQNGLNGADSDGRNKAQPMYSPKKCCEATLQ